MMTYPVTVTVLGCRGSIPVSGDQFSRFGGATCCVFVRAENAIAVLDAGTGLLNLSQHLRGETDIPIFITHCHADHILGIPMCQPALTPGQQICIYGAVHENMDIAAQIGKLVAPPLWPVSTHQLPSEITYRAVEPQLALDGLVVESMEGCHPGGVTVYRLTIGGRRIVYMTDCTITDANYDALLSFCRVWVTAAWSRGRKKQSSGV